MDLDELAVHLAEIDQRSKSNTHRIDKMEERQESLDKLVSSVEVLATRQEAVETDVKEIKSDVKELTGKSGKRWDGVVEKVLWTVCTAVIAFLLARMGLS